MKKTSEEIIFNIFSLVITTLFAFICVLPILLTVSGSFTAEKELLKGLSLIPKQFSLEAYKMILRNPESMLRAYGVTISLAVLGTAANLLISSMTAYVLYRKDFKARGFFAFFFFFTTLFSGGLVPRYILFCQLGLRNTFMALLLDGVLSVFNMITMRSYFTANIPISLVEAAKIDGAGDFRIYAKIVLPASGTILATIGLITAISYWNSWSTAAIYIDDPDLYPLQYFLYRVFQTAQMKTTLSEVGISTGNVPQESYKLAMAVFTMGPVILFYPFVQKYFVSGIMVGAVKG